jgi:hypothetical protein
LFIPVQMVSEMNARENRWKRSGRIKEQKRVTRLVLDAWSLRPPKPPLVVCITRLIGCKGRAMDSDNIVSSGKHIRDAVAEWLGVDDRHDSIVRYEVDQVRAKNGTPGVRLTIWAKGIYRVTSGLALLTKEEGTWQRSRTSRRASSITTQAHIWWSPASRSRLMSLR